MNGINLATAGHIVNILPPQSISGGKTAQAFSLKNAEHVSILIGFGVQGVGPPTAIILNRCTSVAGANPVALPGFRYYYTTAPGAGNDILNGAGGPLAAYPAPPNYVTVTEGLTVFPPSVAGLMYVIELDSADLQVPTGVGPVTEYPYLQVSIADSGNATMCQILAVLTGERYGCNITASATI